MNEANETVEAPEVVEKAAAMGHMTKDEWTAKGRDPEKWRPASEFVERGENLMPILKERLAHQTKEIGEMKQTMQQLHQHFTKAEVAAEQRGWQRAILEIEKRQDAAVEIADVDEYQRLKKEKAELLNSPPQLPEIPQGPAPEFVAWEKKNEWYGVDEEMTIYADAVGRRYRDKNPKARLEEVFEEVGKKVRNRFPENFSNHRREGSSTVEGVTAPVKRGGKTFDDLPKEAKDAYARFAKQIPNFKKEDYLRNYDWS